MDVPSKDTVSDIHNSPEEVVYPPLLENGGHGDGDGDGDGSAVRALSRGRKRCIVECIGVDSGSEGGVILPDDGRHSSETALEDATADAGECRLETKSQYGEHTGRRRRASKRGKKRADHTTTSSAAVESLEYTSSSDDDLNTKSITLSEIPEKITLSSIARVKKIVPSSQLPDSPKKKKFSDKEKAAIKTGVDMFGKGSWKKIKEHYDVVLVSRSTIQIKDCYRTMKRKSDVET